MVNKYTLVLSALRRYYTVTQHSTQDQYPRDRFDDVERYTTQQGAHRKEFPVPKGAGQLNAIILAGGAALAIGIGSYLWLYPNDPLNQTDPGSSETVVAPAEDQPQDEEETIEPEETESAEEVDDPEDRKSTRLNSSHVAISY